MPVSVAFLVKLSPRGFWVEFECSCFRLSSAEDMSGDLQEHDGNHSPKNGASEGPL